MKGRPGKDPNQENRKKVADAVSLMTGKKSSKPTSSGGGGTASSGGGTDPKNNKGKITQRKGAQVDDKKKVSDKWNMDSHKLFWHLDRVEAWQRGEKVAPLHLDMGISSGCNMACTFCYGVIQNRDGFGTNSKNS